MQMWNQKPRRGPKYGFEQIARSIPKLWAKGNIFNIGSDKEVTINELAEKVKKMTGSASPIEHDPYEKAYGPGLRGHAQASPEHREDLKAHRIRAEVRSRRFDPKRHQLLQGMRNIPHGRQSIKQNDIDAVAGVLRSGWRTQGH